MRFYSGLFIPFIIIFFSCSLSPKNRNEKKERNNSKIRNGIVITSKGINVEQAFLMFEDDSLVPEDNVIKVNQKVRLRLVSSGWKTKDSIVFLSGREIIEDSRK